ncbi:hypothetical protein L7F22_046442 [Adiantum nelumboides]|nr:hypothetical protein [Adiantum nelumboides]
MDLSSWVLKKPLEAPHIQTVFPNIQEVEEARKDLLEEIFGDDFSPSEGDDECLVANLEGSDVEEQASSSKVKVGTKRKFKDSWRFYHPWLSPASKDGQLVVQCTVCVAAKKRNLFATTGSDVMHLGAFRKHEKTNQHLSAERIVAKLKKNDGKVIGAIDTSLQRSGEVYRSQVVSVMQAVYYKALEGKSLNGIPKLIEFLRFMQTPFIPISDSYGTYGNAVAAREMLNAICKHIRGELVANLKRSAYFSLSIDESTDRRLEKHLIVYVTYLTSQLDVEVKFLQLLKIQRADSETIYNAVITLLGDLELDTRRFVAIATDGCSTMTGKHQGVVARLRRSFPSLLGIHCIAHREALAVKDATNQFPEMEFMDNLAGKIYSWLGKSGNRHAEFSELLREFQLHDVKILQLHNVRWLSRGLVMARIVEVMPAILEQWKVNKHPEYETLITYQVQFLFHYLADVLEQMNILSRVFQENMVDVSTLGSKFQKIKTILQARYLDSQSEFAKNSSRLTKFLKGTCSFGFMGFETRGEGVKTFPISWRSIKDLMKGQNVGDAESGTLEECKDLTKQHVRCLLQALDTRLGDIEVFLSMKFFEPVGYPDHASRRMESTSTWLKTLFEHFVKSADPTSCYAEREGFVETLYSACPHKSMLGAWKYCVLDVSYSADGLLKGKWFEDFPTIMRLWLQILVVPVSTATCERGFWKQNEVKSKLRSLLHLDTLDAHMMISMTKVPYEKVDWKRVENIWSDLKEHDRRPW